MPWYILHGTDRNYSGPYETSEAAHVQAMPKTCGDVVVFAIVPPGLKMGVEEWNKHATPGERAAYQMLAGPNGDENYIKRIKLVRVVTGSSLKDAKAAVDSGLL